MVYPALLPLMRPPRLPVIDWTDAPADLNGLVRFAERRNLVSARVPSHFKRSLLAVGTYLLIFEPGTSQIQSRNAKHCLGTFAGTYQNPVLAFQFTIFHAVTDGWHTLQSNVTNCILQAVSSAQKKWNTAGLRLYNLLYNVGVQHK